MTTLTRAVLAARTVLRDGNVARLPVRVDALAKTHAFIVRDPLPRDVSGMLIPMALDAKKRWAIVVNKSHTLERQRFTIAHEFGHLMLHQFTTPHADGRQRVRFRDGTSSLGTDREEIEANQFAAELLMPTDLMIQRLKKLGLDTWNGEPSEQLGPALSDLATECKVSEQALLFRIANLLQPA